MIRGILIGILALGVAGTAYWGYQEHKEKNAILINAENNYQRAFHDLTYYIDVIHDKIGTTLAMNSRNSLSPALAEVWKLTAQAHSNVGQLPLTLLPFNKTEEFLSNIGEFTYRTAIRDLEKEPLTDEEYKTLKELYQQAADIQKELRQVQHTALANNLRWMDVELALATNKEPLDNTIIDGFMTVEKTVEGYNETEFNPTFMGIQKKDEEYKHLTGKEMNKEEAVKLAQKYTKIENPAEIQVTENGKGADVGFFSISFVDRNTKEEVNMDITKKGGYPIWFILSREIKDQQLSLNEGQEKAIQFLKKAGFQDLTLFESVQYDHTGVFTFVSEQEDVRVYPDAIKVKVALDNGDIIGFSADEYLKSHHVRDIPSPVISVEEAREKINKNVKIMENNLAIILNDLNEEVLCYEFLGVLEEDTYRIYINSENGYEEKVEKLQNAEPIYEDVV